MFTLCEYLQITRVVVLSVAILVVEMLIGSQPTPKYLLHDQAMLKDIAFWLTGLAVRSKHHDIASIVDIAIIAIGATMMMVMETFPRAEAPLAYRNARLFD